MANITETSIFEPSIYQISTSDPVLGGTTGVSNTPIRQLANRTQWLKGSVDSAHLEAGAVVRAVLPTGVNACIVSGCTLLVAAGNYTVTAGYFYYNGLIYPVAEKSGVNAPTLKWALVDGGIQVYTGNPPGVSIGLFGDVYRYKQFLENAAAVGTYQFIDSGFGMYDTDGVGFGYCQGWQLCNGYGGAPNLTDRFIMGADGGLSNVGVKGGANSVTLTTAQMPNHSHTMASGGAHAHAIDLSNNDTGDGAEPQKGNGASRSGFTKTDGSHSHTINATGGGAPHENRPAFYTLAIRRKMS